MVLGFTFSKTTVYLVENGRQELLKTSSKNVEDLLEERKVVLGPHQVVLPQTSTPLKEGMVVEIRSEQKIILIADNQKTEFTSVAATVGEVLAEKKVVVRGEDIITPDVEQKITGDTEIRVTRVVSKTEEKRAVLPYCTESVQDTSIPRGITKTVKSGHNGEEIQKWTVIYHDGQESSRQLLEKQSISKPQNAVIHVGTGQGNTVSRGGQTFRYRQAIDVVASAYTYTGRNTACGVSPSYGVVAVDPKVIPLGTRLYIEGYGFATALDTGGAIRGNRIDVFLESYGAARNWGVKRVRTYIVE